MNAALMTAAQLVVALLLLFLGWRITAYGGKLLRVLWGGVRDLFGSTTGLRMLSFGLASLYAPDLIPSLVRYICSFILELVVRLPLSPLDSRFAFSGGEGELWEVLGGFCADSIRSSANRLSDAFRSLEGATLALQDLLVVLPLAAVIGQAFTFVPTTDGAPQMTRIRAWYEACSQATRQHMALAAVLLFGAFLSLASIVTIPLLNQAPGAPGASEAELKAELEKYPLPQDLIDWKPATDPFAGVVSVLSTLKSQSNQSSNAAASEGQSSLLADEQKTSVLADLKRAVDERQQLRTQMLKAWASLLEHAPASHSDAMRSALTTFRLSSANRPGSRETGQHFLAIVTWYQWNLQAWSNNLSSCRDAVNFMDQGWQAWGDSVVQAANAKDQSALVGLAYDSAQWRRDLVSRQLERCKGNVPDITVPERPNLGDSLGPIGVIARWLLRTESMPLTLIFGMLGFGIFGSAISRIVRNSGGAPNLTLNDLGVLIINGSSAAVVVFLGVQGGIAAFMAQADKPSNPNPYTLLLTCFIAAIFSEHVWDWARSRVKDQFKVTESQPAAGAISTSAPVSQPTPSAKTPPVL